MMDGQAHSGEAPLEYTVELSDDGDFVVVTMIGDITRTEATVVTNEMYELGIRVGVNCYLLDARKARNKDRPMVNVRFAMEDLPAVPGVDLSKLSVALLVDPADHSHDFYAAFAQSQGIDTNIFWDYDEATAHLRRAAGHLNRKPTDG